MTADRFDRSNTKRDRSDGFPAPVKPLAEMTSEEKQQYARDVRRWLRDGEIRRGRKRPRSMRETEIWLEGVERRHGGRQPQGNTPSFGERQGNGEQTEQSSRG
jgi:hypothetical protein